MTAPHPDSPRCPGCGDTPPPGQLVCPRCQTILAAASGTRRTPAWVIVLLLAVIAALLGYIIYLANTQVMQRNF